MIDVDHFKHYNDHYGHIEGDGALRGIAAAILSIARRADFVARYGGEEFMVVFPGMDDPEPALVRLDAEIQALAMPHKGSPFGRVTISCGCVVFQPGDPLVPKAMVKACDDALYEAKEQGRNRHIIRAAGRAASAAS